MTRFLFGDANLDGVVDVADMNKVLTNYNRTGMNWSQGEFDGDGTVNLADLSNVLANFDKTSGSSAAGITAVPEPATLVLVGVTTIALLSYAWQRKQRT